jgi:tRNA threonylcarbamoyladenosine biosynthesis protein TsaB
VTRILAIETSLRNGSVALAKDGVVVASRMLSRETRSAQSLAPAVKELLAEQGWKPNELDAVGVTIGPGSFTGVRVGVTFAKVFCYAAGAPVVGLTTLEVIAAQAVEVEGELHVVLDAQRNDLFHQAYQIAGGVATAISEPSVLSAEAWFAQVAASKDLAISGAGLAKHREVLPRNLRVFDERHWEPNAETVAQLAHREFLNGRRDDVWKLSPLYLRASAAEEKRAPT